jgi:hypothetical protein
VAAAAFIPQTANAERVCRQDCVGPVCQERCVETEGRGDRREGREYGEKTSPLSSRPCIGSNFWKMDLGAFTGRGQGGPCRYMALTKGLLDLVSITNPVIAVRLPRSMPGGYPNVQDGPHSLHRRSSLTPNSVHSQLKS